MNTNKHLRIAGILQLVQAIPSLMFSTYYAVSIILDLQGEQELGDGLTGTLLMLLIVAFAFLCEVALVWFGYALIKQKRWTTKTAGLICSALSSFSFPHIIGIYTLIVLVQARTERVEAPKTAL